MPSLNQEEKIAEVPPDQEIIKAFSSKKIIDCTVKELDNVIAPAVGKSFVFVGKKIDAASNENLIVIYQALPGELRRLLPAMRINEIPIAINRGIYKEFGDYYGLNVAELVRFCKSHYESESRINTVKSFIKPADMPQLPPSLESQFYTAKNNTITAFTKNQVGGNFETMAASCYDFINKLGLIIFSTKEKYDIMKEAAGKLISDTNLKLSITVEDYNRRPHKAFISEIENWLNDGHPTVEYKEISKETYAKIIAKSKFLTLKAFFHEVQESELDISVLIDSKKEHFIK